MAEREPAEPLDLPVWASAGDVLVMGRVVPLDLARRLAAALCAAAEAAQSWRRAAGWEPD